MSEVDPAVVALREVLALSGVPGARISGVVAAVWGGLEDRGFRLEATWSCRADRSGVGGNEPQDCEWPFCVCDPGAVRVIEALEESGVELVAEGELRALRAAEDVVNRAIRAVLEADGVVRRGEGVSVPVGRGGGDG